MPYDHASGPEPATAERPAIAEAPTRDPEEKDRREHARPEPRHRDDERDDGAEDNGTPRDGANAGGEKDQKYEKKRRPLWLWVVLAAVIIAAAVGGVLWWLSVKDLSSTDDAYTDGRAVTISPKVSGYVIDLRVNDNQRVKTGDLLIQIDPRDYIVSRDQARATYDIAKAQAASARLGAEIARKNFPARLAQAQASLTQAKAQLFQAQAEYSRQHRISSSATTQQNVDQATASLQSAQGQVLSAEAAVEQARPVQQNIDQSVQQVSQVDAQVAQAKAQLDQAELNLSNTRVVAPQDGWITRRNVERGNYVQPGGSVFSLVSPDIWVTANFKENQLNRMRPGQRADVSVDAYPSLKLVGHVDSVQLGSGSKFTAFPAENATGNFVKIVQRVPVKIVIDSGLDPNLPLPLGISVVPTVHLK